MHNALQTFDVLCRLVVTLICVPPPPSLYRHDRSPRFPPRSGPRKDAITISKQLSILDNQPAGCGGGSLTKVQQPIVDLELKEMHCEGGPGSLVEVFSVRVKWKYTPSMDPEFQWRKWDFLALHKAHLPPSEYVASRYVLGEPQGAVVFVTDPDGGPYCVSMLRDCKIVYRCLKEKGKREAYAKRCRELLQEEEGRTVDFSDRSTENFISIGSEEFNGTHYDIPGHKWPDEDDVAPCTTQSEAAVSTAELSPSGAVAGGPIVPSEH